MTQVIGNIVKQPLDAIIHQANCFNTMGSGVAKSLRDAYPEVYEADCKTKKGDPEKLGTFSYVKTIDGKIVYNLYSQFEFGYDGRRYTNYEAMRSGLTLIRKHIENNLPKYAKVGFPCKMGCTRGGGDWNVVLQIIKEVFEGSELNIVICEFKEYSVKQDEFAQQLRKAYKKADFMGVENE